MFKQRVALVVLVILQTPRAGEQISREYNEDSISDVANSILNWSEDYPDVVHEDGHDFIVVNKRDVEQFRNNTPNDFEGSGFDATEDVDPKLESGNCLEPGYTKICSGKGKCFNNSCVCDSFEYSDKNSTIFYRYSGKYCEECPYCKGQRCLKFLSCSNCVLVEEKSDCSHLCPFSFSKLDEITRNVDNDEKICEIENENGCFLKFKYFYNQQNNVVVEFESKIRCFSGTKFLFFTFWTIVVYILLLMVCVPRICPMHYRPTRDKSRRQPPNPIREDVVRFDETSFD